MSIMAVEGPELSPNHCLVCHAHRCDGGWVSLNTDMLEGHAYLCGDCVAAVVHAAGGLSANQRAEVERERDELRLELSMTRRWLDEARAETIKVVALEEAQAAVRAAEQTAKARQTAQTR